VPNFPAPEALAGLTTAERQALRSTTRACRLLIPASFESRALLERLASQGDDIEEDEAELPDTLQAGTAAMDDLTAVARAWHENARRLAVQHAAALTVLGTAILQRLAYDEPPSDVDRLSALQEEPTIGDLHRVLLVPAADLLPGDANIEFAQQ
jgi:hypothetical protein